MGSQEVLLSNGDSNGDLGGAYENGLAEVSGENGLEHIAEVSGENGLEHTGGDKMVKDSLADDVLEDLEDFEEYFDDINDRLAISRMVNDSVMKGMVAAMEQESAERIRLSELETGNFNEWKAVGVLNCGRCSNFTDVSTRQSKMSKKLHALREMASEQFEKVQNEIECARGCNSITKIGSGSELVDLVGILQEKQSESYLRLDKMLAFLNSTVQTVFTEVDSVLQTSEVSFFERQHELDASKEVEDIVMQSAVKSLQEDFEEKLYTQSDVNWLEKLNDISGLRIELDKIVMSLSQTEACLASQGSHDLDLLQHKVLIKENGTLEASKTHVSEIYDVNQLKHMKSGELVDHFKEIITNLKRDHEKTLHDMTENFYSLKREYLKEKGSSATHKKDEELGLARKKIPGVIRKLQNFILQTERFPKSAGDIESLAKLQNRVEFLLAENRELRDCLTDKKKELLQHSLTEETTQNLVPDLKSDSCIEASVSDEVFKYALKELIGQMKCEGPAIELSAREETKGMYELEDSDIESVITQEISGLICREAANDLDGRLKDLHRELLIMKENEIHIGTRVLEKEHEVRLEVEEKERLNQELEIMMEQKDNLVAELSISLSKERKQLEVASTQLSCLREELHQQQTMVAEKSQECESLSKKLKESMEQMRSDNVEMNELNQKLHFKNDELIEANKEKDRAFALVQETVDKLLLSEAREEKLQEDMELLVININGLSRLFYEFESRISEAVLEDNTRLKDTCSQVKSLTSTATLHRKAMLMCQQRLKQRCDNLQKAEAEVDLLGDEVDALVRLLEKIYIALDHYSPVLKHYAGIMDILELVRRELRYESAQQSRTNSWPSKTSY